MTDPFNSLLHVLVIAHPDDESLFFIPTIRNIQQAGGQLWLLCLTNGNYDGLGKVRSKELFRTCQTVLNLDHVILLEEEHDIFDDPQISWHIPLVATCIQKALEKALLDQMCPKAQHQSKQKISFITFDEHGVSGHINHRDTYQAVRYLFQRHQNRHQKDSTLEIVNVWTLQTEASLLSKYVPVYCWFLLFCAVAFRQPTLSSSSARSSTTADGRVNGAMAPHSVTMTRTCRVYRLHQPVLNWKAMASHKSQFVWYRRLFVVFSCYTYVNRLIDSASRSAKYSDC